MRGGGFSELLVWSQFEKATDEIRKRPTISTWCRNLWTLSGPGSSLAPSAEPWLLWVKIFFIKKEGWNRTDWIKADSGTFRLPQWQQQWRGISSLFFFLFKYHFSLAVFQACVIFLLSIRTTTVTKTSLQPESTKVEKTFLLANRPFKNRFQTCNVQHLDNLGPIEPFSWGWREEISPTQSAADTTDIPQTDLPAALAAEQQRRTTATQPHKQRTQTYAYDYLKVASQHLLWTGGNLRVSCKWRTGGD